MTILMTGGDRPLGEERCTCVRCGECNGSGNVWFTFGRALYGGHEYLGSRRCDDLDEMETCDECNGSGITEECDRCALLREIEEDQL